MAGELLEVHFKEGDLVRKGQLLFTIDPRPYEAALAQAQATLVRDKAVAANSRAQAQRFSKLLDDGIVSPSDADSFTSAADAAEAVVKPTRRPSNSAVERRVLQDLLAHRRTHGLRDG